MAREVAWMATVATAPAEHSGIEPLCALEDTTKAGFIAFDTKVPIMLGLSV